METKICKFDEGEVLNKFSDYYVYISTLGSGSFGQVVHALYRKSGQEVAIKIIEKKNFKYKKILQLKKEAEILSSLSHPNIVQFIHLNETQKRIFLVMEVIHKGNLKQKLNTYKFTDLEASQIMAGVLRAVDYIHSKNIIHRDIKPENILIPTFEDFTKVKLADFGLSSQFDESFNHHMESKDCGTPIYMAPEQSNQQFYSQPVDLWSCGILMYMLITGSHPLASSIETRNSYLVKLKSRKWNFPSNFSQLAKNLFLKLVEANPIERYTTVQALNHPWILRQEVKVPLTPFEKLKQYGELLKLKGMFFPTFFICCIQNTESAKDNSFLNERKADEKTLKLPASNLIQHLPQLTGCKTDEKFLKFPRSESVIRVIVRNKSGFKVPTTESFVVNRSRESLLIKNSRNLTPKNLRKLTVRRSRLNKYK